jgi:hypothetical protein
MTETRKFLADHGITTMGDWAALALLTVSGLLFGVVGAAWFAGW